MYVSVSVVCWLVKYICMYFVSGMCWLVQAWSYQLSYQNWAHPSTLHICRHVVNPSVCSLCPLLKAHSFLKPLSSSPQYFKRWVKYVYLCLCSVLVGAHIVICMFVSGTSVLVGASIVISAVISKLFTLALCIYRHFAM